MRFYEVQEYLPLTNHAYLTAVLGIVFAMMLAYLGFQLFSLTLERGMLSPAMRMPMALSIA
nr:hypothetical protein [Halomonas ventosae]